MGDEKMAKKIALGFQDKFNFVLVVGQKEAEENGAMVQGRSMALVDKITDKPEKYSKFMKLEEMLAMFRQLKADKVPV